MILKTLREGVLNDDELFLADEGKIFSGGYIAIVEYYTFLNEWGDSKHRKYFRKMETLNKYLRANYPKFVF